MPSSSARKSKKQSGYGCGFFSAALLSGLIAGGWWLVPRLHKVDIETARNGDLVAVARSLLKEDEPAEPPVFVPLELPSGVPGIEVGESTERVEDTEVVVPPPPPPVISKVEESEAAVAVPVAAAGPKLPTEWEAKEIRGIYLSRYQVTNNASEAVIRDRVRYYKAHGFNTIIHGVWGNGCTMYRSEVMQKTLGYNSCPNLFQDQWLDWMLDEADKQGMQIHAYFEKGIKLDKNSPIFELAKEKGWFVPGVDKTYPGVDHYILDVEKPEVAKYFKEISAEFVQRYPTIDAVQWDDYVGYPTIDAVQWDDYVGYHDELPGSEDRTPQLTKFMLDIRTAV
ncbi:MAG: family 10 glycosylhydrolase, partial [Cyanobacteria bacterium P01_D01_bin.36]